MSDTIPGQDDDPEVTAAELALGLLQGEERAQALRRVLADPIFANEVEAWRRRFEELYEAWPEFEPPVGTLDRLDHEIDGSTGVPLAPARQRWFWPALATASSVVAACLLIFIIVRPLSFAPRPHVAVMMTAIAPSKGGAPVAATYNPASGRLSLARAGFDRPGRSAQLWVIGGDGVPHSLGLMQPDAPTVLSLAPELGRRMTGGATIAVSIEPPGGSPTGRPTGPVVASGILSPA